MTDEDFSLIWDFAKQTLFCSADEFRRQVEGWEVERQAHLIRLNNGPEFHFFPSESGCNFTRDDIRACVQPLIDRYGYALTRTPKQYVRQHRFNRLIGFVPYREDDHDIYYRIERLRHV